MSEATLIFPNMRGGCVTVGNTVRTLFRVNGRQQGVAALKKLPAASKHEYVKGVSNEDCDTTRFHLQRSDPQ